MRAISLFSGGLDSMLAIKLMTEQGIDVTALHINIGFGSTRDVSEELKRRANIAGADFLDLDVRSNYIQDILFSPKYGYGKNFNPCIDCHGYMFKIAKKYMQDLDASFLITGEVLGQRPMSQRKDAMAQVKKLAEDKDNLILRPLCAKLLEPTKPELEGWINSDKLLDISGRSRERQLEMAKAYGWDDFESPGGGCLLTEPVYSQKIREFIEHEEFSVEAIDLLKFGRHFRLPDGAKLVVGRHKEDNEALESLQTSDYISFTLPVPGPFNLIHKDSTISEKELASKIAVSYGQSKKDQEYIVQIDGEEYKVVPFESKTEIKQYFFNEK